MNSPEFVGLRGRRAGGAATLLSVLALAACTGGRPASAPVPAAPASTLVPAPASLQISGGEGFTVDSTTVIYVQPGDTAAARIGQYLAELIGTTREWTPAVRDAVGPESAGGIHLVALPDPRLGEEGYSLSVTPERITVAAPKPAGLFYGVQTLRQLLPAAVEYTAARPVAAGRAPRRDHRPAALRVAGEMLDVSRHFLGVSDVERFIDLLAMYKLNRLHLHLSDDQGWRSRS